jgi:hypothetical protein
MSVTKCNTRTSHESMNDEKGRGRAKWRGGNRNLLFIWTLCGFTCLSLLAYVRLIFNVNFSELLQQDDKHVVVLAKRSAEKAAAFPSIVDTPSNTRVPVEIASPSIVAPPSNTRVVEMPPAQQAWANFQKWHSKNALSMEVQQQPQHNSTSRKFIVGYYSCPNQAGNRLHDFWNALIVAIITNRTLLWKYYDQSTCLQAHKGYNPLICEVANTEQECAQILTRAPWIPAFDEWAPILLGINHTQLGPRNPYNHTLDWQNTAKLTDSERRERLSFKTSQFDKVVVQTSREMFLDEQVSKRNMSYELLPGRSIDEGSMGRLKQLYSEGPDFLYGMLFHDTFQLRPELQAPEYSSSAVRLQRTKTNITIAMHTRHTSKSFEGRKMSLEEKNCVHKVLNQTRGSNRNNGEIGCTFYLMSDRQLALDRLKKYVVRKTGCTTVIVSHAEGSGSTSEHGPFAGLGFFQVRIQDLLDLWVD